MIENKTKLLTVQLIAVVSVILIQSFVFLKLGILTSINLLLLSLVIYQITKSLGSAIYLKIMKLVLGTVFLMNWSLAITGMEYLVYEFDWNSFGIPINLNNNPALYSSDFLANQEFPHYWIYKISSLLIETNYFETFFFMGFILQNFFLTKSFEVLFENGKRNLTDNYSQLVLILPLFLYPQISGHYTSLPFFLPAILGYSLAIFNISNFIYKSNHNLEDYFYLILLILIHPFWSLFIPLYIGLCYLVSADKKFVDSARVFFIFILSYFLNNLDGISITEIYKSELIEFYKSYIKIHFDWSGHIGLFFQYELNNFFQQSTLAIIVVVLFLSKGLFSFKTVESTFYTSLGWISLIIISGNLLYDSAFNNFLISSNFYRIGSLTWFFIGIFILKNVSNKYLVYLLTIWPLLFYLSSTQKTYKKNIDLVPNFDFSSKYTYIFIAVSIFLLFLNKQKFSFRITTLGFLYFYIFNLIDKIQINNYLIVSVGLSTICYLGVHTLTSKKNIGISISTLSIYILFLVSTLFTSSLQNNLKYEYKSQISVESILLIKDSTTEKDLILIDPSLSYFRKETKRGVLIDYSLIPYSSKNYEIYKTYKALFNGKNLPELTSDEIMNIINNSNVTDLLLPKGSISQEYFINKYDNVDLKEFGYLILDVKN